MELQSATGSAGTDSESDPAHPAGCQLHSIQARGSLAGNFKLNFGRRPGKAPLNILALAESPSDSDRRQESDSDSESESGHTATIRRIFVM